MKNAYVIYIYIYDFANIYQNSTMCPKFDGLLKNVLGIYSWNLKINTIYLRKMVLTRTNKLDVRPKDATSKI